MGKNPELWVLVELRDGGDSVTKSSLEIFGLARRLADEMSAPLCAVIFGENTKGAADESRGFGCDRIYVAEDESLSEYHPDPYLAALEKLCANKEIKAILGTHSALGLDLFPRLAARLKTRAVTDCVYLEFDRQCGSILTTKPIYGGNALAVFRCISQPLVATVRAGTGAAPRHDAFREGEIVPVDLPPAPSETRTRTLKRVRESDGAKLEDASVVVSGGRGIGGSEGFDRLRELAELLGGVVGASRPPCDMGWIPSSCQVGFTGKIVAPELYLAVGISGTMQHLSGMFDSKHIVAVNKDPEANIFGYCDYGVVGDYSEVIPAFTGKAKELLAP